MKVLYGYQDIRTNNEDLVLTPFLGRVLVKNKYGCSIYGLSITWLYHCFHVSLGFNLPENYPNKMIKK